VTNFQGLEKRTTVVGRELGHRGTRDMLGRWNIRGQVLTERGEVTKTISFVDGEERLMRADVREVVNRETIWVLEGDVVVGQVGRKLLELVGGKHC
jgi:translation initiation factor IF-1